MAEEGERAGVAELAAEVIPPRWRGLKRALLVAGVVLVALVALRWVWGCEAERRLQAKIDEYRAAGEPILIEDFARPPIPDEDNAAVCYREAHAAIVATFGETVAFGDRRPGPLRIGDLVSYPGVIAAHAGAVDRLMAANAQPLRLTRQARDRPSCDWDIPLSFPLVSSLNNWLPLMSAHRQHIKLLCGAAVVRHERGDDAEAVELLRDAVGYGDRMHDPRTTVLGHLVAAACYGLVFATVEGIGASILVTPAADKGDDANGPARREGVEALIIELLDDAVQRDGWYVGCLGERMYELDTVVSFSRGVFTFQTSPGRTKLTPDWWEAPIRALLKPLWLTDGSELLDYWTALVEAGRASNWPEAVATAPECPEATKGLGRWMHYPEIVGGGSDGLRHALMMHFEVLARRRMAAVALAIRLYELDHGAKPAALARLVPDYLPAVPVDPFAADGAPLRYAPEAERPVLYSVGANGADDGGCYVRYPEGGINWELSDIPFALDGGEAPERTVGVEAPSASQQAVHDDADVQDDSGNDAENEDPDNRPE